VTLAEVRQILVSANYFEELVLRQGAQSAALAAALGLNATKPITLIRRYSTSRHARTQPVFAITNDEAVVLVDESGTAAATAWGEYRTARKTAGRPLDDLPIIQADGVEVFADNALSASAQVVITVPSTPPPPAPRLAAGLEESATKVVEDVHRNILHLAHDADNQRLFIVDTRGPKTAAQIAVYDLARRPAAAPTFPPLVLADDPDAHIDAMAMSAARRTFFFLRWHEKTGTEVIAVPFPHRQGWSANTTAKVLRSGLPRGWSGLAVQGNHLYVLAGTQESYVMNAATGELLGQPAPVRWPAGTPLYLHLSHLAAHGNAVFAAAVTAGGDLEGLWILEGPVASTTWRRLPKFTPERDEILSDLVVGDAAEGPSLYVATSHRILIVSPAEGRILRAKVVHSEGTEAASRAALTPGQDRPNILQWGTPIAAGPQGLFAVARRGWREDWKPAIWQDHRGVYRGRPQDPAPAGADKHDLWFLPSTYFSPAARAPEPGPSVARQLAISRTASDPLRTVTRERRDAAPGAGSRQPLPLGERPQSVSFSVNVRQELSVTVQGTRSVPSSSQSPSPSTLPAFEEITLVDNASAAALGRALGLNSHDKPVILVREPRQSGPASFFAARAGDLSRVLFSPSGQANQRLKSWNVYLQAKLRPGGLAPAPLTSRVIIDAPSGPLQPGATLNITVAAGLEEGRSAADTARFALPPAPQIPAALALPAGVPLNQDAIVERLRQAMEDRGLHHAMALAALEQRHYLEARRRYVKADLAWHAAQTALRQQRQNWASHLWVHGPLADILNQVERFLGDARYAAQSGAEFAAQQGRRVAAGLEENTASERADATGTLAAVDMPAQAQGVAQEAIVGRVAKAWEQAREAVAEIPEPLLLSKHRLLFVNSDTWALVPLAVMRGFKVLVGADGEAEHRLRLLVHALALPEERCVFLSPAEAQQRAQAATRPDSDVIPVEDEAHLLAIFGLPNEWPTPVAAAMLLTHRYLAAQAGLERGA
ncbi:MAG: hypothetical protein HY600_06025, partial [Candidatus Omnitrophica bacterium]|nr:hypothetical protein [Candidatus Omnitrophota bacterium]